ncbi:glycoside hydrolase family 3 C-terminal domain-containing protein [Paraburkholderia sp.]|uniref:beta-glucosidase family protein n=1 Tax=Paraburkholderia sp. TaxID=1926495 RepID=UPI0023990F87|nr:glycoside hydrolase family 3 C-terminal domain-containing protein [Paraburkholderia sp.]MDE1181815.1 glycoside hydrolase family 3 C-terminal domain-containing protein [Paraburkholderia sp.]
MGARVVVAAFFGAAVLAAHSAPAGLPTSEAQVNQIALSLLNQMTQSEKLDYVSGTGAWDVKPIARLGLPQIKASDAGLGVRLSDPPGVAYPAGPALASTWNVDRAKQMGVGLGLETRLSGFQQIAGPGMDMYRTPYAGRAFEYVSGEDPFLGAVMAAAEINGIQSQGVWADAKHYLANEQEVNRFNLMETVSERALREIYMVPFESSVKNANVAVVMCGFQGLNGGDPVCENQHVMQQVLKNQWGFLGFVESDYAALKHTLPAALAGVDIERPTASIFSPTALSALLSTGQISESLIDDKVRRILSRVVAYGFQAGVPAATGESHPDFAERAALDVAREGIVLLKNDNNVLPLSHDSTRTIAVIGKLATAQPPTGFGSANIIASRYISEISGLQQVAGNARIVLIDSMTLDPTRSVWTTPTGAAGIQAEYFGNANWSGSPVLSRVEPTVNLDTSGSATGSAYGTTYGGNGSSSAPGSVRWTGNVTPTISGAQVFKVRADGAVRLYVNGQLLIDNGDGNPLPNNSIPPTIPLTGRIVLQAGQAYTVRLDYSPRSGYIPLFGGFMGAQLSWASLVPPPDLATYDAVVVAVGNSYEYEGEGFDHPFTLPEFQDELLTNVGRASPRKSIAVVHGGTGLDMHAWIDTVPGVLHAWYPGENGGQALAEILFGDVNPSGKLPITIERSIVDNPTYANYPQYSNSTDVLTMTYTEDIFVGYRGYEKNNRTPLFPFGFGLSYTTFRYSALDVSPAVASGDGRIRVSFNVTNTGGLAGAESAQVYVGERGAPVARPIKELKGFGKVFLQPGETQRITVFLNQRSLAYFDVNRSTWVSDAGSFDILVGASSQDIRLRGQLLNLNAHVLNTTDSNPLAERRSVHVGPVHL